MSRRAWVVAAAFGGLCVLAVAGGQWWIGHRQEAGQAGEVRERNGQREIYLNLPIAGGQGGGGAWLPIVEHDDSQVTHLAGRHGKDHILMHASGNVTIVDSATFRRRTGLDRLGPNVGPDDPPTQDK